MPGVDESGPGPALAAGGRAPRRLRLRRRGATRRDRARPSTLAFELVRDAGLERLVSARYPLERYEEAVAHAAAAGRRGAVKIVFDLRKAGSGEDAPGAERPKGRHRP